MRGVRIRDRTTGEVHTVDPRTAQAAVVGGQADLADRTVRIVGEAGRTGTVDSTDFVQAVDSGWTLSDEEGAAEVRREREAQSVGGQALGTAEALGRGVTLGLSDDLARRFGVDPEGMEARREAVGNVGTTAEVVGAVAPSLISGGTGAAATAARFTPAALAARGGVAASRLVPGAGRAAGLARAGVAAGVEGGVAGAGMAVSEAALLDRDVTGEDLAHGALLGGVLGTGSAFGVAGLAAAARGTGRASVRGWQRAAKAVSPHGDDVSRETAGALRRRDILASPKLRRAATAPEDVRREVAGEVGAKYARARSLVGEADDLIRQQPGRLRGLDMREVDPALALPRARETASAAQRRIGRLVVENPGVVSGEAGERIGRALGEAQRAKSAVEAYRALDEVGGILQRESGRLDATGSVVQREAAVGLRGVGTAVESILDDRQIWHSAVDARAALKTNNDLVAAAQNNVPAGLQGGKMDAAELVGLARKGEIDEALGARLNALDEVSKRRELPKTTLSKIDEAKREIADLRLELKRQKQPAEALELMDAMGRTEQNVAGVREAAGMFGIGSVAGSLAGGLGLGGLGSIVGLGAQVLARPRAMMATAAQVVDFAQKLTRGREAALANFGRRLRGSAPKLGKGAKGAVTRITRQTALSVADKIGAVSMDDVVEAESNTMQHLGKVAPKAANRAVATAVTAVEFLKARAPTTFQSPWGGRKLVDPVSADRFARYVEAVADPGSVWERLASGTLTSEHVEAIKAVYPATYREVQGRVWDELGKLDTPPPYETRITLGVLLDLPTDPSLDPRRKEKTMSLAPPEEMPAPSGGRSTVLAGGSKEVGQMASNIATPGAAGEVRSRA